MREKKGKEKLENVVALRGGMTRSSLDPLVHQWRRPNQVEVEVRLNCLHHLVPRSRNLHSLTQLLPPVIILDCILRDRKTNQRLAAAAARINAQINAKHGVSSTESPPVKVSRTWPNYCKWKH